MIYSLPYFISTIFLAYIYGLVPFIIIKKPLPYNPITPILIGFAVLGIMSQWFFIGGPINEFSFMVVFTGALAAIWRFGFYYKVHAQNLLSWVKSLSNLVKAGLGLILFVLLYQSSLPTKINDMGGYYLQTIQWMQQHGVVKGLGNLHPALGLGSAWHSLLCLTQIPFLPMSYQINGIIVFVVILYLHFQFTQKQIEGELNQRKNKIYLLAFVLLFMPLSFLYLTAPSPDLPVLIFIPLLFYWFWFEPKTLNAEILLLLACFVFAIKPPAIIAVTIGIFTVVGAVIQKNVTMIARGKRLITAIAIAFFCLGSIIYKNYIQTGLPLYPSAIGSTLFSTITRHPEPVEGRHPKLAEGRYPKPVEGTQQKLNAQRHPEPVEGRHPELTGGQWQIPADWNKAYRRGIVSWGINDSSNVKVFKEEIPTTYLRLLSWVKRPGYKGLMNKLIALNFILGFILLFYLKTWQERFFIVLLLIITFIEYSFLSQYRLMLATAITLFAFNACGLTKYIYLPSHQANYNNSSRSLGFMALITLIYYFMAFVPLSLFKSNSRNKSITQMGGFTTDYLVRPHTNYRTGTLETFMVDSITFHYYSDRTYAWNAPIPAVSLSHRQFLEQNFHYRLRAIGKKPEEGFYLEHLSPE
jgi:hypothetical protein